MIAGREVGPAHSDEVGDESHHGLKPGIRRDSEDKLADDKTTIGDNTATDTAADTDKSVKPKLGNKDGGKETKQDWDYNFLLKVFNDICVV